MKPSLISISLATAVSCAAFAIDASACPVHFTNQGPAAALIAYTDATSSHPPHLAYTDATSSHPPHLA